MSVVCTVLCFCLNDIMIETRQFGRNKSIRAKKLTSVNSYVPSILRFGENLLKHGFENMTIFCTQMENMFNPLKELAIRCLTLYILDVLWGQPIKLIQVASNSELCENQWNDLLFFEIVPSHCFGAFKCSKNSIS